MKQQNTRGQFTLTREQIEKIIDAAENTRDRVLLKILAYTGARRAEISGLTIHDFFRPDKRLKMRCKGKERLVPIPPHLAADLTFYLGPRRTGFIFPARSGRAGLSGPQINRIVAAAAERAKVKNPDPARRNVNPHIFRHSLARYLKSKNVQLEIIRDILGHKSIATTADTYGRPSMEEIQKEYSAVLS